MNFFSRFFAQEPPAASSKTTITGKKIEIFHDTVNKLPLDAIFTTLKNHIDVEAITPRRITGEVSLYRNGKKIGVDAQDFFVERVKKFSGKGKILAVGGIDYLITATVRPFNILDILNTAFKENILRDGWYQLYGPSAPKDSVAEIFENIRVHIKDGEVYISPASYEIDISNSGAIEIEKYYSLDRVILGQYTVLDLYNKEKKASLLPQLLEIHGKDTEVALIKLLKEAMIQHGIKNGSMYIYVKGKDMRLEAAVLDKIPDKPITSHEALLSYQKPFTSTGGFLQVHGHWTNHHYDSALFNATGLRYTSHAHCIGEDGKGSPIGGHVSEVYIGKNTTAYVVIKAIEDVVEIDAKPKN